MYHNAANRTHKILTVLLLLAVLTLACRLPFLGQDSNPEPGTPDAAATSQSTGSTPPSGSGTATPGTGEEDLPPVSFLELLEEGIENGRWTRGEGTLYLLEYLAGERELEYEVAHQEGTMIVGLAEEYIAKGENEDIKNQLQTLLQDLFGFLKYMEDYSLPAGDYSRKSGGKLAQEVTPTADEGCDRFWDGNPFPELGKLDCALYKQTTAGGVTIEVYYPIDWHQQAERQSDIEDAFDALVKSAETYARYGQNNDMALIFSPFLNPHLEKALAGTLKTRYWDPARNVCPIVVFNVIDNFEGENIKENVAHEAFHCFQYKHLFNNNGVAENSSQNAWWREGTAVHFSNVAYPSIKYDYRFVERYDEGSQTRPLKDMSYENYVFFTDWMNQKGNEDIIAFLESLLIRERAELQMEQLAVYKNMNAQFHHFGQRYLDQQIPDVAGDLLPIPASVPRSTEIREPGPAFDVTVEPFQLFRLYGTYREERKFTQHMDYEKEGTTSMRHLAEPGAWQPVPDTLYSRCEQREPHLFLITSAVLEGNHTSALTIDGVEDAACDGCLLGYWAVEGETFKNWFNTLAESAGSGSQGRILSISGLMGTKFAQDRSYLSINKDLSIELGLAGQADPAMIFTMNSMGQGSWQTNQDMNQLQFTQQDLKADFIAEVPGVGELPFSGGSIPEGALPPSYEEAGIFSDPNQLTLFGSLSTETSAQGRSYTCQDDTLTFHFPQYSDIVMSRLEEPITPPELEGSDGEEISNP